MTENCELCSGVRVVPGPDGFDLCPACGGTGEQPEVLQPPDPTLAFHPTGVMTPLSVATKVLARSKEKDVVSLVSYMTIATEQGVSILPFVSNIGLAEMSMISITANAMAHGILTQGIGQRPAGPDGSA